MSYEKYVRGIGIRTRENKLFSLFFPRQEYLFFWVLLFYVNESLVRSYSKYILGVRMFFGVMTGIYAFALLLSFQLLFCSSCLASSFADFVRWRICDFSACHVQKTERNLSLDWLCFGCDFAWCFVIVNGVCCVFCKRCSNPIFGGCNHDVFPFWFL